MTIENELHLPDARRPAYAEFGVPDGVPVLWRCERAIAQIPEARLVTYPGEAHLSTLSNHFDEIAQSLTGTT